MPTPRITTFKILSDTLIAINFDNGITKHFDFAHKMTQPLYAPLKNKALFQACRIEPGGVALSWTDDIDISEHELWMDGVPI